MTPHVPVEPRHEPMPRVWRMVLVALSTLILCSCRSQMGPGPTTESPPALPREAIAGEMAGPARFAPEAAENSYSYPPPLPYAPAGPWAPPGIRQPWPEDEYLADGGDRGLPAEVANDWEVRGLEPEDTVGHFDTLDGRTLVEPSNPVRLYAPRFGAVRQVVTLAQGERTLGPGDVHQPTGLVRYDEIQEAASSTQSLQPGRHVASRPPVIYRAKQSDGAISSALGLESFQDAFLPYENLKLIRLGAADRTESARLAEGVAAAIAWSHTQAVQVILDRASAAAEVGTQAGQTVFAVKDAPAQPRLRVIKVASTPFAEPGDTVDFTIRFDNVGNQTIGNVTILDSLSTRLELVPGSAQCSVPADFSTGANDAGSLVLRWEIRDPLPTGQGGVLRFRCRVR